MLEHLYFYIPLLTMGLMSREFSSGSIKLLYSSPVTSAQIILGKYLSVMIYCAVLLGVILVYVGLGALTIGHMDGTLIFSNFLGMYLLICAYAVIGLFMSCLTSYQVVAAIGTLAFFGLAFTGGKRKTAGEEKNTEINGIGSRSRCAQLCFVTSFSYLVLGYDRYAE